MDRFDANLPGGVETLYYHQDRQYNIIGLTDDAGNVVERYAYSPYGERRILAPDGVTVRQTSAVGNPLGHQGLYHDDETSLIYNRARYRDAGLGRWLGRDPIGYADSMNLYGYIGSQVFYWTDPMGLEKCQSAGVTSFSLGARVVGTNWVADLRANASLEATRCTKCCPEGSKRAGEEITDVSASGGIDISLGVGAGTFRTEGSIGDASYDAWLGIKGDVSGGASGSISLESDLCNDREAVTKVCISGNASGSVAVGGNLELHAGWFHFNFGLEAAKATVKGSVTRCCDRFTLQGCQSGWKTRSCGSIDVSTRVSWFWGSAHVSLLRYQGCIDW